jgi:hypothetical protein
MPVGSRAQADALKAARGMKHEKIGVPHLGKGRKKATLLRDTLEKVESYHEELEREITGQTEIALALDDETGEAHNIFLFGRNGRSPVRDLDRLSEMTKVPVPRLEILAPIWLKEAMRMAREASPLYNMVASTKARTAHFKDLDSMRKTIDALEAALPDIDHPTFPAKYRFLMEARKEWQTMSGIMAAISISESAIMLEVKAKFAATPKQEGEEVGDLSAFDVDV